MTAHEFARISDPCHTLGMPSCQNWLALTVWCHAINELAKEKRPIHIIELGSYNGSFATQLAIHIWNLKRSDPVFVASTVDTFDRAKGPCESFAPLSEFVGLRYHQSDIFAATQEIVDLIQQPGISVVLCDGGDKPREMNLFAEYLKPGDVIASHDWMTPCWPFGEIWLSDVHHTLPRWLPEVFDLGGWLAFRKP